MDHIALVRVVTEDLSFLTSVKYWFLFPDISSAYTIEKKLKSVFIEINGRGFIFFRKFNLYFTLDVQI